MNPFAPVLRFLGDSDIPPSVRIATVFLSIVVGVGLIFLTYGLVIGAVAAYVISVILLIIGGIASAVRVGIWLEDGR